MSDIETGFLVLLILIVVALLLPARFDPAIRLKEWTEDWKRDHRP